MIQRFVLAVSKTLSVFLLAISLLTAGFAHNAVMTADDLEKAEFLISMGLAPADLCAVPGEDGGTMDMGDCPVCQLAGAMHMPDPMQGFHDIEQRHVAAVLVPAKARVFGRSFNPATPVRAPPLA